MRDDENTTDSIETDAAFAEAAAAAEEAADAINGDLERLKAAGAREDEKWAAEAKEREAQRREAAHAALDDALATLAVGEEKIGEALELLREEVRAYRSAYDIAAAVGMTSGVRKPELIQGVRAVDSLNTSRKKRGRPAKNTAA